MKKLTIILAVILAILLLILGALLLWERNSVPETAPTVQAAPEPTAQDVPAAATVPPTEVDPLPTEEPTVPVTEPAFAPACVSSTDPDNWNIEWKIIDGDAVLDSYSREAPVFFENRDYFVLPGVAGFRGGSYRTGGSYGTAEITEGTINELWKMNVGFLETADWIGCGWTGQPLVVQWDAGTRAIMNLYEEKQKKEDLVEAIYPKLDGYVHFIDMEDGSFTRDPLYIGRVFKGSGALDPRGYPVLYLGVGLPLGGLQQSILAVSLIDGSILYELPGTHKNAQRYWYGFDGGPLVDAETDTLIWAGENSLIYTIKLNTSYDKAAGTLTMAPEEPVVAAFRSEYGRGDRFSGYEASATAAEHYLYLGDNSGLLQCVDLNTMELIWVQDIFDDINATPLFDWETESEGYLYVAPSVDYNGGDIGIYKINAQTGEIVWSYAAQCSADSEYPGGVMASPILGKAGTNMEDMILFSIGRTPDYWSGQVIAFHKRTGEVLWQHETNSNIWSSPVALYTEDDKGYVFQADMSGTCYLLDGQTGEVVDTVKLNRTTEASPVAFGNRVLLGTRSAVHLFEIK